MSLPNVTHITLGEKIIGGIRTGRPSIKVHVVRKARGLDRRKRVPRTIPIKNRAGNIVYVETDVIETGGKPQVFGFEGGDQVVAINNKLGIAGLTFAKGNSQYAITNAHVACLAKSGNSDSVCWLQGTARTLLGPVIFWTPLDDQQPATDDAAVIRVDQNVEVDDYAIGGIGNPIQATDGVSPDSQYWFSANGEIYTCGSAEFVSTPTQAIDVDGIGVRYKMFWQLQMIAGQAQKGISGSLLCSTVNGVNIACGLIFGGVPDSLLWAFDFKPLFDRIYSNLPA